MSVHDVQTEFRAFQQSGKVPRLCFIPRDDLQGYSPYRLEYEAGRPAVCNPLADQLGFRGALVVVWDGPRLITDRWLTDRLEVPVDLPAVLVEAETGLELIEQVREFATLQIILTIGKQLTGYEASAA